MIHQKKTVEFLNGWFKSDVFFCDASPPPSTFTTIFLLFCYCYYFAQFLRCLSPSVIICLYSDRTSVFSIIESPIPEMFFWMGRGGDLMVMMMMMMKYALFSHLASQGVWDILFLSFLFLHFLWIVNATLSFHRIFRFVNAISFSTLLLFKGEYAFK